MSATGNCNSGAALTTPPLVAPLLALLDPAKSAKDFNRSCAFYFPSGEFTDDAAKDVYLNHLLGPDRIARFGTPEEYLTEFYCIFHGPPPDPALGIREFCLQINDFSTTLGFEMFFDNTEIAGDVQEEMSYAFDSGRANWSEWAVYRLGNGNVEHGAMFCAKGVDGGIVYCAYFGE